VRSETSGVMPVLWVCGPPGVGKTVVGWEIYSGLVDAGIQTGYVDIDQLGMCYPEPVSDPGRHRMKARNLGRVVAGYQAAGARCVVVSGVVDAGHGVYGDELPGIALTVCRLRADPAELERRFTGRGGQTEGLAQVMREAADLDASRVGDVCVDTSGLAVAEVARRIRDRTDGWPRLGCACPSLTAADVVSSRGIANETDAGVERPTSILWLCGATGVGKSTVGFHLYLRALQAGLTAAYLDIEQIGFCGPVPADHTVKARNMASVWRTYRESGARALLITGPIEDDAALARYSDALSPDPFSLFRLHAGHDQLLSRIMLRGEGRGSWPQPGDPLLGQPAASLLAIAEQAARDTEALEQKAIGHRIDTNDRTVAEIADTIGGLTAWPAP
jgi:adenylylsulfate kinase-like enzyme